VIVMKIRFDWRGFTEALRRKQTALADLRPQMAAVGAWLIGDARKRLAARASRTSTGRLGKSLQAKAFRNSVTIGSTLPYAGIQQRGGVVHPRKRKMLAIPLQEDLRARHVWPKQIPPEQLYRVGSTLMFIRKRRYHNQPRGEAVPGWRLVKQAKIKARPYLVKSRELIEFMRELIGRKLR